MFNKSVIATSVALLLTACGSDSSSDGDSSNNGFTITGFDGYLENAVMFIDLDNSGSFNEGDKFLGLTNNKGQLTLDNAPDAPTSLQTLVIGETAQLYLASLDPKYSNVYTTDADRPSQPLSHEYVLNTKASSDVVSPLTDLVVLEMAKGVDETTAIANINGALGLNADADLFVDFVAGADADEKLHKTAQVLADSKAEDPYGYSQNPTGYAEDATQFVNSVPEEKLSDPHYRESVDGDTGSQESQPTDSATYVNAIAHDSVQAKFDALELTWGQATGTPLTWFEADIGELFKDSDTAEPLVNLLSVTNTDNNYVIVDKYNEKTGVVSYIRDNKLIVGMNSSDALNKAGNFHVEVEFSSEIANTNSHSAIFTFEVAATDNMPPQVHKPKYQSLQAELYDVNLFTGTSIEASIDVSELFENHNQEITLELLDGANLNGLNATLTEQVITLSGTPTGVADKDALSFTLSAMAADVELDTQVIFNLPAINSAPLDISKMENKVFYRAVINIYADIRKCEAFKLSGGQIYSKLGANKSDCPTEEPTETVGSYIIKNNQLIPFSGKYPEDNASARTLLANKATYDSSDRIDVTRFLVTNGITSESEHFAVEYFDYARYVENIVKETDIGSWYNTTVSSSLKADGTYQSIWVSAKRNDEISFQGESYNDIKCNDLNNYYETYEVGQQLNGEYQKLGKYKVSDVCIQYSDNYVALEDPNEYGNGTFIFTITPKLGSTTTPMIERTWVENRN